MQLDATPQKIPKTETFFLKSLYEKTLQNLTIQITLINEGLPQHPQNSNSYQLLSILNYRFQSLRISWWKINKNNLRSKQTHNYKNHLEMWNKKYITTIEATVLFLNLVPSPLLFLNTWILRSDCAQICDILFPL